MTVTLTHLSCGRGKPLGIRLFPSRFKGHMECHCILIEAPERMLLIDCGLSEAQLRNPARLGPYAWGLGLKADPQRSAATQLRHRQIDPAHVTDIVLTHLDVDHAGGIVDFPDATVHVHCVEHSAAFAPKTLGERFRYRRRGWENVSWRLHGTSTPAASSLPQATPTPKIVVVEEEGLEISLIPFFGHTRGHCAVLIQTDERLLLHSGDVYYDASELERNSSFFFECFRRSIHVVPSAAGHSLTELKEWSTSQPQLEIISSHDPAEFARYTETVA